MAEPDGVVPAKPPTDGRSGPARRRANGMTVAAIGFQGTVLGDAADVHDRRRGGALAIAWINSLGNLGGFFGPWYVGVMKDASGSFAGGLYGLALLGLISSFVCAFFLDIPDPAARVRGVVAAEQARDG